MLLRVGSFQIFVLLLASSGCALAQLNASLQGVISDSSGGLVPGAHIKLENIGTHATQDTTTNDQGFYRFNQLPSGTYKLTIDANGFQTATVTNVQVLADLPQSANATLQPGNIQTTTTVTASAVPTLQTADASVSGTVTSQAIEDLPTAGRDPYELIRTLPGVDGTGARGSNGNVQTLGATQGPGQSNVGIFQTENQIQISSAGQRVEQNVFYIDGVNVNSLGWGGAAVVTPNTESVQDMTVITADYDAGDGRGSGAHIKTTTKSGTDEFHGSGVLLYQDPNFNAYNKWGGPSGGLPTRVENNYRQYAGSVGGPIKKNKFFFFLSYEGLKNKSYTYGDSWITTADYRSLVVADRPNSTIAKILTSVNAQPRINAVLGGPSAGCSIFGANAATVCRQVAGGLDVGSPGPGLNGTPYYAVPPSANVANPEAPLSIGGGFDGRPDLEYVQYALPTEQVGNQFNGRFDFNLTSKDTLFASAYITHLNQISGYATAAAAPDADLPFKPTNSAVTVGYIRNWNATTINELRGNFTRFADNQLNDSAGDNWGIPYIQLEAYPFGDIGVAGLPWGTDSPGILAQNTYEARDTLTKVIGTHTIRFGGEYRWEQDNDNLLGAERPLYSFSGLWNLANDAPVFEEIYANAATGGIANGARYYRDHIAGVFTQDDWHVTSSLTVNLGLRWEYFSPLGEKQGDLYNIFFGATGPNFLSNAQLRPVSELWNSNWKDFEPRVGFAYAPTALHEKFVVRGGAGILYNRQNDNIFANSREDNPNFDNFNLCCGTVSLPAPPPGAPYGSLGYGTPFAGGQIKYSLGTGTTPYSYPANPALATGVNPVTGTPNALGGGTPPAVEVYGAWPNTPDAYTYLYSFETQTELAKSIVLTIGYQGALSRHLIRLLNQNFLYNPAAGGLGPYFYAVYMPTPDVNSSYNAMNARIAKTFSQGFSMDATYTWSKCIDMLSAEGPGATTNQTDPVHAQTDEYGPCDYDSRNRFVANGLWTLPIFPHSHGLAHTLLGGWQLGGILTAYSGFPWTPVTGNEQSLAAVTGAATINPTRPVEYYGNANPGTNSNACFMDGCEFGGVNPNEPIVGTDYFNISHSGPPGIGRNSFRGPGYFSTDATLSKRFGVPKLGEAAGIELRGYAFNVFNQLNLQPFTPLTDQDTHVENPNFGRPDAALAGRSIELQVRVTW